MQFQKGIPSALPHPDGSSCFVAVTHVPSPPRRCCQRGTHQEAKIHLVAHMLPKKMELPECCAEQNLFPAAKCQP